MHAEIIAVGSELLTPQKIDTNSLWLTDQLNLLGVDVALKMVVGDDRERLAAAVQSAAARSPIVIVTGGLGPTEDDVTREAVAQATHRRLLFSQEICDTIEARFARMARTMAEVNKRQAFVVEGAEVLANPNGTAPGLWLDLPGRILMLLPGPPRELKPMFESAVLPRLRAALPQQHLATRHYRVAGMGESDLDQLIAPIYKPYDQVATTILAASGDIQIHLRCFRPTQEEAESLVAELGAKIQEKLGSRIYSANGEPIEAAVGKLLEAKGATLSVAESCTSGMVAARITEVPGSSHWFLGGFIVYGTSMKTRLLGLDEKKVHEHGVVSESVAMSMADSARDRTGATYGISVTGEAGPLSSTPGVDPGTVWIGIASPEGVEAKVFRFPGDRQRVREFAVQTALNLVRHRLL